VLAVALTMVLIGSFVAWRDWSGSPHLRGGPNPVPVPEPTDRRLWEQAAVVLEASPGAQAAATRVRTIVTSARRMYAWMTQPDGKIVQIGDSDEIPGDRESMCHFGPGYCHGVYPS